MDTIRVLLVDDQEIIRRGMATILRFTPGIEVVGDAGNGNEAIAAVEALSKSEAGAPDVVLMDVKMPGLGGIPATRAIVKRWPQVRVVILTTYDADNLVFDGIKAGARGYLLKDAGGDTIVEALRGAALGESQIDPKVATKVLGEFQRLAALDAPMPTSPSARAPSPADDLIIEPLTPREEDVLHLLAEGMSNKEIAARLFLTEGTVKNHVSAIIAKLQANDRTQAVVKALRRGLVNL